MTIKQTLARAIINLLVDNDQIQSAQITALKGETIDGIERAQNYGFTSVPHAGAEALVVFRDGNRSDGIIIKADDRRYRLHGLKAGEVAIYTDEGQTIKLLRGGIVEINAATVNINGESGDVVVNGISLVNHTHPQKSGNHYGGGVSTGAPQ